MCQHIPIPYRIILDKIISESCFGEITIRKSKLILSRIFRMGNKNYYDIIREMQSNGWVEFNNHASLIIKVKKQMLDDN